MKQTDKSDFSKGSVCRHITALAIPMTVAQVVQMLYNIVDRIYIGHLPGESALPLAGLGLTFPIITLILATTNLFGMGGSPLFSIARGKGNEERAQLIMGNCFFMLCASALVMMAVCYIFMEPILYLFGASDNTYPYASQYLMIYLIGTPFTMMATGMNGFINAQGFGRTGMATILVGAVTNIVLDPIFIFLLGMGVRGAALATIISQFLAAIWVLRFFTGNRTMFRLNRSSMKVDKKLLKEIVGLGTAGFVMQASNGAVQIACNTTLRATGGDLYVSIMTVLSSLRDVVSLPVMGLTAAAQPVLGFNYGARKYDRIRTGIIFMTGVTVIYMLGAWFVLLRFPDSLMKIFTSDVELITKGVAALHLYYFGFFMMAFQTSGQSAFVGLGLSRQAVFFSILRKIIIVVPLTFILPHVAGLGVNGVFLAEPISNFIGGTASYTTMVIVVSRLFRRERAKERLT